MPQKRAKKPPVKAPAPRPLAWRRGLGWSLGLVLAFVLGWVAGSRQGWVEERAAGNGKMSPARKKVIQLEDGRWVNHGEFQGFYEDGKTLKESGEYFRGLKHGPWKEYGPDGKLKRQGSYVNGQPADDWREFDERGAEIKKN